MKKALVLGGLIIATIVVLFAPLASPYPDGLERVAENHQFIDRAQAPLYKLLADYAVPGMTNERLSTVVAGLVGVGVVFVITVAVGQWLRRGRTVHGAR